MSGSMNFSVAPMQYGATNSMTVKQEGTAIKYSDRAQFKAVVEALEETYKPEETGLTYKTPTTAASVWEAKSISDLKAIDLSGKEVVYQISGTSVNAQGKGFGLMVNLYADGLAVTTQYTKGTPITITYYGYWEKTDDPAIDVTQFGCVISDAPAGSAYERFNDTEYGADKNCNTYNSFTISNNALSGSMNFSVAPMQYGATNSMTVKQEGTTIKYSDKAQFKAVVEALEETYTPTEE